MNAKKIRWMLSLSAGLLCFIGLVVCRKAGQAGKGAPEAVPTWTLTLAAPIDHLDMVAREPMIVEHADGTLFVAGFGASRVGQKSKDEPTLWKSRDAGTTWARIDVGTEADGAIGNSDVDLAVSTDGTLYFVNLLFDEKKFEGRQVSVGVSKNVGATLG